MTSTQRGARGIWTAAAIIAGLNMIVRASGDSVWDLVVAVASAYVVLLALCMVQAAGTRRW